MGIFDLNLQKKGCVILAKLKLIKEYVKEAQRLKERLGAGDNNFDDAFYQLTNSDLFRLDQKKSEIYHIYRLINSSKSKIICEIGAFRGGSCAIFCHSAPDDATIISIDIQFPIERKIAHKVFGKTRQKLICIKGDSQEQTTIGKIKNVLHGKVIDLLFIDGDHSLFGVMNDYVRFSPLVRHGGIIAFHDINPDTFMKTGIKTSSYVGEVPIFWETLKKSKIIHNEIIEDPEQDGFGIGLVVKE